MSNLVLDSIAVDCPDPVALSTFYADLLAVENRGDFFYLPGGLVEIWFQQVGDYQPPTWPSQERGQQVHFDITVPDVGAAVKAAMNLGATLTERRADYHYPILLDPVGHPFCLVAGAENSEPHLSALSFDCNDAKAMATFYRELIGGETESWLGWTNLLRPGEPTLSFQNVEGYQPPTWPTQERGQQIHIDFHTDEREEWVQKATTYGAHLMHIETSFTVMVDPDGHPFCICDSRE